MRARALFLTTALLTSVAVAGGVSPASPDHAGDPFLDRRTGRARPRPVSVDLLSCFLMEEIGGGQAIGTGRGSDVWGGPTRKRAANT
jgi:hypothetical protein